MIRGSTNLMFEWRGEGGGGEGGREGGREVFKHKFLL